MPECPTLDLVAACLEYPSARTPVLARQAAERTAGDHVALARALWDLAVWLERAPLGEAEERYTTLFDLDPVCTLHIGYQVFGDTYPRGAFIANLARELRQAGVDRGDDLPDFLPVVLRLLAAVSPDEAEPLLSVIVRPALAKMRQALEGSRSPWSDVIRALPELLGDAGDTMAPAVSRIDLEDSRSHGTSERAVQMGAATQRSRAVHEPDAAGLMNGPG
jgi:nitrate reductase delta subunit